MERHRTCSSGFVCAVDVGARIGEGDDDKALAQDTYHPCSGVNTTAEIYRIDRRVKRENGTVCDALDVAGVALTRESQDLTIVRFLFYSYCISFYVLSEIYKP